MHPPLSPPLHRLPYNEARSVAPGIRFRASRESSRSLFRLERRGGAA